MTDFTRLMDLDSNGQANLTAVCASHNAIIGLLDALDAAEIQAKIAALESDLKVLRAELARRAK